MSEKKKSYYCPFDLQPIEINNLAYELVFNGDLTYNEAEKSNKFKELIEDDGESFVEKGDKRRKERFGLIDEDESLMILENGEEGGESGLSFLVENVKDNGEKGGEAAADKKNDGSTGLKTPDTEVFNKDEGINEKKIVPKRNRRFKKPEKQDKYNLVEVRVNEQGNYEFYNKTKQKVMTALPCCPHCHMRLPKGWMEAEDFFIVSLIGPTGSGKTTMILSMMADKWKALKTDIQIKGFPMEIDSANYDGGGGYYDKMAKMADQLSNNEFKIDKNNIDTAGRLPDGTDTEKAVMPVFLSVRYKKHRMIVGIYDNAGENLEKPDTTSKDFLKAVIDNSNADVYLFDPEDMNIELVRNPINLKSIKEVLENCTVDDIEEQGKRQAAERKKRIAVKEILKHAYKKEETTQSDKKGKNQTTFDVYRSVSSARSDSKAEQDKIKNRRFLGVIIKSDLLMPVIEGDGELFRDIFVDPSNTSAVDMTTDAIKDMIEKNNLFKDRSSQKVEDIGKEYKGLSWHCISALGGDAEMHGRLFEDYAPIRVAEPMIRCIVDRIADNGWINESTGRGGNK